MTRYVDVESASGNFVCPSAKRIQCSGPWIAIYWARKADRVRTVGFPLLEKRSTWHGGNTRNIARQTIFYSSYLHQRDACTRAILYTLFFLHKSLTHSLSVSRSPGFLRFLLLCFPPSTCRFKYFIGAAIQPLLLLCKSSALRGSYDFLFIYEHSGAAWACKHILSKRAKAKCVSVTV